MLRIDFIDVDGNIGMFEYEFSGLVRPSECKICSIIFKCPPETIQDKSTTHKKLLHKFHNSLQL